MKSLGFRCHLQKKPASIWTMRVGWETSALQLSSSAWPKLLLTGKSKYSGNPPYGHLVITAFFFLSRQNAHTFSYERTPLMRPTHLFPINSSQENLSIKNPNSYFAGLRQHSANPCWLQYAGLFVWSMLVPSIPRLSRNMVWPLEHWKSFLRKFNRTCCSSLTLLSVLSLMRPGTSCGSITNSDETLT